MQLAAAQGLDESPAVNEKFELKTFIDFFVDNNKNNRKKTSQILFDRLGSNADTGLLKPATYTTLGYQIRKSTYSFPPELSTRLYQLNNPFLQVDTFESLDKSWAILNSTQVRLSQTNWMDNIIKANLIINAVKSWNVVRNIPERLEKLSKLEELVNTELTKINNNRQNYSESEWSKSAVLLTSMRSDINSLRQFYFSEQANLFNTTGFREIDHKKSESKDDFLNEITCRPYQSLNGLELVPERFRKKIENIYKEDSTDKETTWVIAGLVKEVSIARLSNPEDKGLKMAGELLVKLISKRLFELNNGRYRSFDKAPGSFFQSYKRKVSGVQHIDNLKNCDNNVSETTSKPLITKTKKSIPASNKPKKQSKKAVKSKSYN